MKNKLIDILMSIFGIIAVIIVSISIGMRIQENKPSIQPRPANELKLTTTNTSFETSCGQWVRRETFIITTDTYLLIEGIDIEFRFDPQLFTILVDGIYIEDLDTLLVFDKNSTHKLTIVSFHTGAFTAKHGYIDTLELITQNDLYIKWYNDNEVN